MAVIGRLDGQVDAVLIEPLRRGQGPGADEAAGAGEQGSGGEAEREAPQGRANDAEANTRHSAVAELPVWLL